jgi:hypothetical protein
MRLPNTLIISIFALVHSTIADSGGLENPGLQPLIQRANGLLAAGQFNDAVKALTDALGIYHLLFSRRGANVFQNYHLLITSSITNEPLPNSPYHAMHKLWKILTVLSSTPKEALRKHT